MTTRGEAYAAFAYAYDEALGNRFFKAVRTLLDAQLKKHATVEKTHLDIACGTGLAIDYFARRGWRSVGVDASFEMLSMARKRSRKLVAGDFRTLPLRGTFAWITCLYDSLNHIREKNDLITAFRSIRRLMSDDSLLLFDINHPDIYPVVWGMAEPFVADGLDYHLEIATTYRKREATGRARVTGWAALPDGSRATIDERHSQRAWREREIAEALTEAGLAPIDVIEFDPYGEAESLDVAAVKLFYVCAATPSSRA